MENMFTTSLQKIPFICGDFNIDLLNPKKHPVTEDFIDTMHSMGLHPKITKLSGITSHCATLIDTIFTNIMENNKESGLLYNDIIDHLPVFIVYHCTYWKPTYQNHYKYKRERMEENINAFKYKLLKQNWKEVFEEEKDIDEAYNVFLKIFISLSDKNCPVKQFSDREKQINSPWITKRLQNACKKKNTLYWQFLKSKQLLKQKI